MKNINKSEAEENSIDLSALQNADFSVSEKINLELLNKGVQFLTGCIEELNSEQIIKWIVYENLLPSDPKNSKILTLYLNSQGGNLSDALAIVDVMKSSKHPIRVIGVGQIISAAFLVFSAGTKGERYISKNTSIMCHQYSGEIYGKHHDMKAHVKEIELSNLRMMKVLEDTTGLDRRTIKSKLLSPTDVWLTPDELIKLNVADHLI